MNPFKLAYKNVRDNSDEIFRGFGFKHLSDVTQYYVHPNNQSSSGTTTLCQPIGEAIMLFARFLKEVQAGNSIGDYYASDDLHSIYLEIDVPDDYRDNGVVARNVFKYKALCREERVCIAAYNKAGILLKGNIDDLSTQYKLLPVFLVLLAREMETNADWRRMMDQFVEKPVADLFVNLHEDFYQNHKMDDYDLAFADLTSFDHNGLRSYSASYAVIRENQQSVACHNDTSSVVHFADDAFTDEQKAFIPILSSEFVLPENLENVCSAVASGDVLAVLLHGPAGTGKTISCKLICQEIGLPIMETVNCTENLDEYVLGKYIPMDDRIVFKESYVTEAIRNGGAVVFEEINFAKPQYLAFLNSLLDDNGFVRLDNGDVVKRHPNFRFFATMNMGYFGTKELNQALYNRFNSIIEIAALSDEAIIRMLTARVPECTPVVDKLLGVYHKIKKKVEAEELDVILSPRNLENWARMAKYDGYIKAAEKTIIPVAKCDRVLEDAMRGVIMLYKW